MKKFNLITLGCRVNQCESDALSSCLGNLGFSVSNDGKGSDLCVINTCAVTQKAAAQSRRAIRKAIRNNPSAQIVVAGCYAQTFASEIEKMEGVDYVVGNADKHAIPEIISRKNKNHGPALISHPIDRQRKFAEIPGQGCSSKTRPSLKIQDGCDSFCSYCIVPYARGRSRSMPFDHVLGAISKISAQGHKEVVLSGIHIGRYGRDLSPQTSLHDLISIIDNKKIIPRVRLSSIEPPELKREIIIRASASEIICHHFHIPLQSGDDGILKKMNRPYSSSFFRDLVLFVHELIPDAAIGVDILEGFPGETDQAFENTYALIKSLPVSYLHVFPFSRRENTPAWSFPDQIPHDVIVRRCAILRDLGAEKKQEFYKKFVGKRVTVLFENQRCKKTGRLKGITSNYLRVVAEGGDERLNSMVDVRITKMSGADSLWGECAG